MLPEEAETMSWLQVIDTGLWVSTGLPPSLVMFHTTFAVNVASWAWLTMTQEFTPATTGFQRQPAPPLNTGV
jgi:hypothetical protein